MRELRNKEVFIGLIVIIILGIVALILLIKRELRSNSLFLEKEAVVQQESVAMEEIEDKPVIEEEMVEKSEQSEGEETAQRSEQEKFSQESSENVASINEGIKEKRRYSLYSILGEKKYSSQSMKQRTIEDGQLEELYGYWDAYRMDAVADLVRLERIQKISEELEGTDRFYYYGTTDSLGRPSGKGLAVYENNTFYFGDWKEGLREGKGMWLQVAIYGEENKHANLGVIEHSYNGFWKKDLPNGEGQEHFSYDYEVLKEDYLSYGFALANVLGNFKDGYYHGEMYIMTVDEEGHTTDWLGNCKDGVWVPVMEGNTTDAVWESYEKDEQGKSFYHFLFPKENQGFGILGLMK